MVPTLPDYEVEIELREKNGEETSQEESAERPLRCSFCRLSHEQVDHLIRSPFNPEATICGACVMHARAVLDERGSKERREDKGEMKPENRGLRCSFCNKALEEVAWLVTPPATTEVTICGECVAFAVSLLLKDFEFLLKDFEFLLRPDVL